MISTSPSPPCCPPVLGGLFHDPRRLVVGDAPFVGVLDVPGTVQRPPVRLYYPAELSSFSSSSYSSSRWWRRKVPRRAGYFVNDRLAYFLQGFAHVSIARHNSRTHVWILRPLLWLLSYLLPVRGQARDSGTGRGVITSRRRLVLFSHWTAGEENSIFCASLARRGYVVVSVHHRDGSSCRAPSHDGSDCIYYEHFPTGEGFDPRRRLRQVHVRVREFLTCRSWIVGEGGGGDSFAHSYTNDNAEHMRVVLDQIRPHLDDGDGTIAAGFSYGAATAALAATLMPEKFNCVVLLDPWLHIDYTSRGVEFDFPPEAFGSGWPSSSYASSSSSSFEVISSANDDDADRGGGGVGLSIPSVFINSSQFCGYEKLYAATRRLADRINNPRVVDDRDDDEKKDDHPPRAEMHVIPNTTHSNFCDIVFWIPRRLIGKAFGLGDANPYDVYEEILDKTVHFLRRH
ncbi:hypothetical protein ACHAXA_009595 [Cyclostephanos tholiformis]|uniref:1-alkyl-2-acetylglycerophosphocholine esterase n=1 Tax=Cyclostephanos tholiformis TaxID=382380 RepID=A0ABD3RFZ5_9STRA